MAACEREAFSAYFDAYIDDWKSLERFFGEEERICMKYVGCVSAESIDASAVSIDASAESIDASAVSIAASAVSVSIDSRCRPIVHA